MPTEPTSAAAVREARVGSGVRRQVRDATAVAAVSLIGSVLVVAAVWVVGAWLS